MRQNVRYIAPDRGASQAAPEISRCGPPRCSGPTSDAIAAGRCSCRGGTNADVILARKKIRTRVRMGVFTLLLFCASGCDESRLPTAPLAPPPPSTSPPQASDTGSIYGVVMSPDRRCLVGATLEMLDGPRAGERAEQSAAGCEDVMDGGIAAFAFNDLSGGPVTLRASVNGYEARTLACQIRPGAVQWWHSTIEIVLSPAE